jgi:hypothetical protein
MKRNLNKWSINYTPYHIAGQHDLQEYEVLHLIVF